MASSPSKPIVLAVRLRGTATDDPNVRKTMQTLALKSAFSARLLENNPSILGMLRTAKSLVAWGEANPTTVETLLRKRAEREAEKKVDDDFARLFFNKHDVGDLANSVVTGEVSVSKLCDAGVKPTFRLHPPRGGFRRSIRRAATDGGELGARGGDINRLVQRMI